MSEWVAYADCVACKGRGWHIGGDDMQQCPSCSLRLQREEREKSSHEKEAHHV